MVCVLRMCAHETLVNCPRCYPRPPTVDVVESWVQKCRFHVIHARAPEGSGSPVRLAVARLPTWMAAHETEEPQRPTPSTASHVQRSASRSTKATAAHRVGRATASCIPPTPIIQPSRLVFEKKRPCSGLASPGQHRPVIGTSARAAKFADRTQHSFCTAFSRRLDMVAHVAKQGN